MLLTVLLFTSVLELGRVMMYLHVLFRSDLSCHHSVIGYELKFINFEAILVVTYTCPLVIPVMIGHSISFINKLILLRVLLLFLHASHMSLLLMRSVIRKDALSVTLCEHGRCDI